MTVFWFRRDLRLSDNAALSNALHSHEAVLPIFIFDENILSQLEKDDARVTFIHKQLENIQSELNKIGKSLAVFHGTLGNGFQATDFRKQDFYCICQPRLRTGSEKTGHSYQSTSERASD